MFGVTIIAMLLAVSSVGVAQADTNYNEPVSVQTSDAGVGGAGDDTAPGIPNTGPVDTTDPVSVTLVVLAAVAVLGTIGYLLMRPRDRSMDI